MEITKLAEYEKGLTFEETIWAWNKAKLRGLTMQELDERLVKSDQWKQERELYPLRSGTFAAYEEPDVELKEKIEFEGYNVIVPKAFQGKKNIALMCNFPDFILQGKTITSDSFKSVEMPAEDGWYNPESEFEFPTGKKKDYSDDRRYLWRRDSSYLGLLSRRGGNLGVYDRRLVDADDGPDDRRGVAGVPCEKTMKHTHEWVCPCGEKHE